jgi:hypothetical protein
MAGLVLWIRRSVKGLHIQLASCIVSFHRALFWGFEIGLDVHGCCSSSLA